MSHDDFLNDAWANVGNFAALKKRYNAEAKDPAIGLALARLETIDEAETGGAMAEEGSGALVVPLVLAHALACAESNPIQRELGSIYRVVDARALPALRQLVQKCQDAIKALAGKKKKNYWDEEWWRGAQAMAAACMARAGDTKEAELMRSSHSWLLRALVPQGVAIDAAIELIQKAADEEDSLKEVAQLVPVVAAAGVKKAAPALVALVRSGIAIHALAGLATLRAPEGAEAARRILRETGGRAWDLKILTLGAQAVLWQQGEKFPLDLARASLDWPMIDYRSFEPEALLLRTLAMDALRAGGDSKDKERVRRLVTSPYRIVREAAKKAFDTVPELTAWDPGRVAWAKKNDPKSLLAALDDPNACFVYNVAGALAKDTKARPKLTAMALSRIEAITRPYDDDIKLDADVEKWIEVAESLAKSEKKTWQKSASPWVHVKVLEEDEDKFTAPKEKLDPGPRKAKVTRFDAPLDWFPGATRVALAAGAERMLILGKESFLFDPRKSVRVLSLGDGSAVSACAVSEDGKRVALARGAKVEILDDAGKTMSRAEVPGGVSALAFSPDGGSIACGTNGKALRIFDVATGKDAHAFDGPGACAGVVWLGPKRAVFLASKGQKSVLVDLDVPKKKHAEVAVPPSTMIASFERLLATAGGKKIRLHDSKLKTKVESECASPIKGIAVESERALIALSEGALERVRVGGKAPTHEGIRQGGVLQILAASGKRLYGLADGTVFRFHEDDKAVAGAGTHSSHVTGVAALPDGRVVTTSWDGRVLLWKPEGGLAETLFDRKERVDSLAVTPDGKTALFDDGKNLRAIEIDSRAITSLVGGGDIEPDLAEHMPGVNAVAATKGRAAWGGGGAIHLLDLPSGEETASVEGPHEVLVFDDEGNVYGGSDDGEVVCVDAKGGVRWKRVEHGVDVLDGKLHGNPHRTVAALSARGKLLATLASDDTVRVFDGPSGERKMRYYRDVGLFNGVAISRDQKLVAFTWGHVVEIVDIASAKCVCLLEANESWAGVSGLGGTFSRPSMMALAWTSDASLIAGAENGSLWRVVLA